MNRTLVISWWRGNWWGTRRKRLIHRLTVGSASQLVETGLMLHFVYWIAFKPPSSIGLDRKCISVSFFPVMHSLIIDAFGIHFFVLSPKPLVAKWKARVSTPQPTEKMSIGFWSRPSAIGRTGTKMR